MTNTEAGVDDDEDEVFHDSFDPIASTSSLSSDISESGEAVGGAESGVDSDSDRFVVPKFPMGAVASYDLWLSEPVSSVEERRSRLLRQMGLSLDPVLARVKRGGGAEIGRSVSSGQISGRMNGVKDDAMVRSKSESSTDRLGNNDQTGTQAVCATVNSSDLSFSFVNGTCNHDNGGGVLNKPPSGRKLRNVDGGEEVDFGVGVEEEEEGVCRIKNLDNGKEFVVNGMWNQLKEVGTGKQFTLEEFEMCAGHSPIVQELMRRQNVEEAKKDDVGENGSGGSSLRLKKRGSWLKSLRGVTGSVVSGLKERRSSDEREVLSDRGGRRSSSATDDSQDVVFRGPERVRIRHYGKSCKELSALYKCQEIRAHNGSIWTINFSLDGRYLASAGEDCVIHVWQVLGSERKGDLLTDECSSNILFLGSPEPSSASPNVDSPSEKKRRSRSSLMRKSVSMDHIYIPETVFALSEKPFCSFLGHTDDVLDLSWSKSQHMLSSSMDKTVRLWHLSSQSCLKIFTHNDYVTCIQFNPADERFFISGSLDAKVRIWSIPEHQVVDWTDLHEMVTAACYTPDGQGALVGSYKGSCQLCSTSENKLLQKSEINLQNKKKKSHKKKITGFQFMPGSQSEVLVTSADSRVRVIDGVDLIHKFKGFQNTHSQISASLSMNGKYIISASEDSNVYVWRHEADSQPSKSKTVTATHLYEHFHCQDVSVAVPWPGTDESWGLHDLQHKKEVNGKLDNLPAADCSLRPIERSLRDEPSSSGARRHTDSPNMLFGVTDSSSQDRISEVRDDEIRTPTSSSRSPRQTTDLLNGVFQNKSAWGMVIVTGSLSGELRTFQNFGLPVRI